MQGVQQSATQYGNQGVVQQVDQYGNVIQVQYVNQDVAPQQPVVQGNFQIQPYAYENANRLLGNPNMS